MDYNQYKFKLYQSFSGRTSTDQFDNEWLFETQAEVGDPIFRVIATQVGSAWCPILTRQTRLLRAVITQISDRKGKVAARGKQMSIGLTGSGTHGPADPIKQAAPQTFCANFDRDAAFGFAGRWRVRGCYLEDEVDSGPDQNPTTKATFDGSYLTGFGVVLLKAFTDHEARMVLPAPSSGTFDSDEREVKNITYTGLAQHQRFNSLTDLETLAEQYFRRYMKDLERRLLKLIKHLNGILAVGALLITVLEEIITAIQKFGIIKVLAYEIDQHLKQYVTLAAAKAVTP